MFSKPLAHPSTLDRRLSFCRASSYVEELWSPILARRAGNAQAKADAYSSLDFSARGRRDLSLSGGASISIQNCFKLSITFCSTSSGRLSNKKATHFWVALVWLASAARDLAQGAPSEGYDVTGPANHIAAMQARQTRHGDGRFGK
jgi:hypothetical protein